MSEGQNTQGAKRPPLTREQLEEQVGMLRKKVADLARLLEAETAAKTTAQKKAQQLERENEAGMDALQKMQQQLSEARAELADAIAQLQEISGPPNHFATVLQTNKDGTVDILDGGKRFRVRRASDLNPALLVRGTTVKLASNLAVLEAVVFDDVTGGQATLVRTLENGTAIIQGREGDTPQVVAVSDRLDPTELKPGVRVIMGDGMVIATMPPEEGRARFSSRYALASLPDVTFADIGGLDSIIEEIRDGILGPYQYPERYERYQEPNNCNILLKGSPGVGKTMLAKAIARELMERFRGVLEKHGASGNFFAISGPEMLDKWLGNTEGKLRGVYDSAGELHEATGVPVVVFLDDPDAFLRGRGTGHYDGGAHESFVTQMLTILDGIRTKRGIFTIMASNRPDILDAALKDRMQISLTVPAPTTRETASAVLRKHLAGVPFAVPGGEPAYDETVAEQSIGLILDLVFARTPETQVLKLSYADREDTETLYVGDVLSGRKLKQAVARAKRIAIKRDERMGLDPQAISGVTPDDLRQATRERILLSDEYPRSMQAVQAWLTQRDQDGDDLVGFENLRTKSRHSRKRRERIAKRVQ